MHQPDRDNHGQTNVGAEHASPVAAQERLVVLAANNDQAHEEGDNRACGEERRHVGQVLQAVALLQICAAETVVSHGNTHPGDEASQTGHVHQPQVRTIRREQCGDEADRADSCGCQQRVHGHAAGVDAGEHLRRLTLLGEREEHTSRNVQARVTCREHCGEDHGVHDGCREGDARTLEDEGERGDVDVAVCCGEQVRVGVRNQEADDDHRTDVEEHDAPEHAGQCAGHVAAGVLRFAGSHTDHFGALEGEACHHEDGEYGGCAADEGCLTDGPVGDARGATAQDAEDHGDTCDEEDDHGNNLDGGEPEFAFTVGACREGVDAGQQHEESCRPHPGWDVREPVPHHLADGDEFGGDGNRPVEPVVPTHGEAEGRGHVACRVGLECAGDGQVRSHLAEGLHEEEHHDADEGVGEDCAAGACGGDGLTGGDEEAGADCAADCDHLHVAGGEASLQFTLCGGGFRCNAGSLCRLCHVRSSF